MQIKKYLWVWILPLAMLAVVLAGCGNAKVRELDAELDKFNKTCPIDLGFIGQVDSAAYDEQSKNMVIYCSVKDSLPDVDDAHKELSISNLKLLVGSRENAEMTTLLADMGAGISVKYIGANSPEHITFNLTAEELKQLVDNPVPDDERYKMLLENFITAENLNCPREIEEGVTLVNVEDDGENLIYNLLLDENKFCVQQLEENIDQIHMAMEFNLRGDAAMANMSGTISDAGRGLIYRYTGDYFGRTFDIAFDPESLKFFARPNAISR